MGAADDEFVALLTSAQLPGLVWVEDPLPLLGSYPAVWQRSLGEALSEYVQEESR